LRRPRSNVAYIFSPAATDRRHIRGVVTRTAPDAIGRGGRRSTAKVA